MRLAQHCHEIQTESSFGGAADFGRFLACSNADESPPSKMIRASHDMRNAAAMGERDRGREAEEERRVGAT